MKPVTGTMLRLAREEQLAAGRMAAEQRDYVVRKTSGARMRLEVRMRDRCKLEAGFARELHQLLVRVEVAAARHRFGRGRSAARSLRNREDGEPTARTQHPRTLFERRPGSPRKKKTCIVAAQVNVSASNGKASALPSTTSSLPSDTASALRSRAARTISGL